MRPRIQVETQSLSISPIARLCRRLTLRAHAIRRRGGRDGPSRGGRARQIVRARSHHGTPRPDSPFLEITRRVELYDNEAPSAGVVTGVGASKVASSWWSERHVKGGTYFRSP